MTVFLMCGIVGLVLLLTSMIGGHDTDFDHDIDHGDGSTGVFSYRMFVVFLTGFGWVGAICSYYGKSTLESSVWGVFSGLVFGVVAWLLMNIVMKQQASSLVSTEQMIGKEGVVNTTIPTMGTGDVVIEINGQRKYMPALAYDGRSILSNTIVMVIEVSAGNLLVKVKI